MTTTTNPYLANFSGMLRRWLHATLNSDPVLAELGVRAYVDLAHDEDGPVSAERYVVYRITTPPAATDPGFGLSTAATATIQVEVNGAGTGYEAINPVQDRLLELLGHVVQAEVPGGHIQSCRYANDVPTDSSVIDGTRYYRAGARYRVVLGAY